jgi:nucleoid-associated protein YgaU
MVILLLGAFLAVSGAQLAQRLQASATRRQSLAFEDHIGLAANTTGLIVVAWWALSFLIAVVAAVLERTGSRRAAAAAGKFSPAFMRRLALAAVGLQLMTTPLAHAEPGVPGPVSPAAPPAVAAAWVPAGGPPETHAASPPPGAGTPSPPGPARSATLGLDPHWMPSPPPVEPRALAAAPLRGQDPAPDSSEVTVRAGDSLWSICAAALGPLATDVDVALAWPLLYQANREVIGPDPALLLPGQVLRKPAGL